MIKFYYHPSPNPAKVALFLEEAQLPYELIPIDTRLGQQHTPEFKAINPNAKTPALVDGKIIVFDSNAILLYLSRKTGKFLPLNDNDNYAELYSWLMFIATGVGPYSGQAVHFKHFSLEKIAYAQKRYEFEAWRHWEILNTRLNGRSYILGSEYTIVDMAFWGWARLIPFVLGDMALEKLSNVKRLLEMINARPAAVRAEALKDKHSFKMEMDANARSNMFPHVK